MAESSKVIEFCTSKLQEDLKKKSTSDQKDYEKKTIHRQTFLLKHPQLLLW